MRKPKIGLLCFYLKLYDETVAWLREERVVFQEKITEELRSRNLDVVTYDMCRVESEFSNAISHFEANKVDAVVTLHLAYSPSMESEKALRSTHLPIIVLDTTIDSSFDGISGSGRVMQNHGIHGVQDMCSLLRRNRVDYQIFAGHYEKSQVLTQVANAAKGAMIASSMKNCRVGRIGVPFYGMGDFYLPDNEFKDSIGFDVIDYDFADSKRLLSGIDEKTIVNEWEADCQKFDRLDLDYETYAESAKVDLIVRKWIGEKGLDAFTVNFMATDENPDLPRMPFVEACKAMNRGIGYAGEGDVLTAAFVSALMSGFNKTTFAEMFCPDWDGNSVFLSHMGEYNIAVSAETPLLTEMDFPYTSAGNPAALYGAMKKGRATFLNLNPLSDGEFTLIASEGAMLEMEETADDLKKTVRGWFKPDMELSSFLASYSEYGGGHHAAIVYECDMDILKSFAKIMGWKFEVI